MFKLDCPYLGTTIMKKKSHRSWMHCPVSTVGDDAIRLDIEDTRKKADDSDYQSDDEKTESDSSSSGDCQMTAGGEVTADYVIQILLGDMLRFVQRHPHMTQNGS